MAASDARSVQGEQAPKKKRKVKVTRQVDGHPVEEEIEIDDTGGPTWLPKGAHRVLDHEMPRVDAPDKVSGRARYTHDIRLPGMVYARLLLCPAPVAKVTLDVEPAKKVDGVVAARVVREGETRYLGQAVAVVAARTPEIAEDGLRAIAMKIEPLPFAVTREQALADGAPEVNRRGNASKPNEKGDRDAAAQALKQCDAVIEATYSVPVQHHACLETHGLVVDYRGGDRATVYFSTQAVFASAGELAEALGVKEVEVITDHMGGGFGSKFSPGLEGKLACELARDLKVPVHLMLTRRDEFLIAGNRSGCVQTLQGGATKDGTFVALAASVDKLGGLSGGSHPGQPYIYKVGTSYSAVRSVHTHTDGSVAMRAPGHPQASFGIESMVDELAYAIGFDPLEFRKRNLPTDVHKRHLDRVAREIGWFEHAHRTAPDPSDAPLKVGIGFGVSRWGGGGNPECVVTVEIRKDGAVDARVGAQDLGTGTRTYVAAIVAEELGLKVSDVGAHVGRSSFGPSVASGGSVTTASLAPAVKHAAYNARTELAAHLAKVVGCAAEDVSFEPGAVRCGAKKLSWRDACATLGSGGLSARGEWQAQLADSGVHGAQAVKVQVDTRTGEVRLLEMVCMQDCGLPLNRSAVRSQIQGGMVQALSYGLFEERVIDPDLGLALNANLEDYKLAGSLEIPKMTAIIDDQDARGVIGMAEATIIPGHAAIANAIFNACGARVRTMPLTADKVLMALEARKTAGAEKGSSR